MINLPDVRRTLNISRPYTGQELGDAFKKILNKDSFDCYREDLVKDHDGDCEYTIGIDSRNPGRNVCIVTGDKWDNTSLKLDEKYNKIAIMSTVYIFKKGYIMQEIIDSEVVNRVDEIKKSLEAVLN